MIRKSASTLTSHSIGLRTATIPHQPLAESVRNSSDAANNTVPLTEKELLPWIQGTGRMSSKTAGTVSLIVRSCLLKHAYQSKRPIPDEDTMMDFTVKALESLKNNLKPTGNPDFDHKNLVVVSVYYGWLAYFKPKVSTVELADEVSGIVGTDGCYGAAYADNLFDLQLDLFSKLLAEVNLGCAETGYRDYLVRCVAGDKPAGSKGMAGYVKTRFKVGLVRLNEDLVAIAEVIAKMKSMRGDE